ncbi:MAG: superoxide dismutase [Rhizobacter sp.]|jgi:Cu-Zn family superoxide dismutase|nr:superoxide dismutase [Rhizobacter sp.]
MQVRSILSRLSLPTLALSTLLAGCGTLGMQGNPKAIARLEPTKGNTTAGVVTFEQQKGYVVVVAKITGLTPNQEHGFHVHEKGDCSSGDGMSAGGHFNPLGHPHGGAAGMGHAGDMPNLKADSAGEARVSFQFIGATVGGGATDIIGRGLIVHAKPDDYRTQPTGDAGGRLACAVIRAD